MGKLRIWPITKKLSAPFLTEKNEFITVDGS